MVLDFSKKMRPNSIIMSDWGAYGNIYNTPEKLVTDIIILSLLYDEVLIQDEVFVLSDLMPKWFERAEGNDLLAKIFELDSIVLLGWKSYPSEIKTDYKHHPMFARAEYHEKFSTRGDSIFIASESNKDFYKKIEYFLTIRKSAIRDRGAKCSFDVNKSFCKVFTELLSKEVYKPWLSSVFPEISSGIKDQFLNFAHNPNFGITELIKAGKEVKSHNDPVFNRSLGFQLSTFYKDEIKYSIQRLIQSAYAIPLCESEEAVGKYGYQLKEVPWFSSEETAYSHISEKKVTVEAEANTNLSIPSIISDFPQTINSIRQSDAGKALRYAMREIGNDTNFTRITHCWEGVAEELASCVDIKEKKSARTTALRIGEKIITGTVIGELSSMVFTNIHTPYIGALLGTGIGLSFDHGLELMKYEIQRQKNRQLIESLIEFRCSWIPFEKN